MTPLEKANAVKSVCDDGMSFTKGDYTFTIRNPRVYTKKDKSAFICELKVMKATKVLFADEVRIVNPPQLVDDPNGDVIRGGTSYVDRLGNKQVSPIKKFRLDPKAALKEVLIDLIKDIVGAR